MPLEPPEEITMTATHPAATRPERPTGRAPRSFLVSALAVPVLVVGQFAMLAIVPVAIVLVATLRDARLRALRWWAAALAATYATPLVLWAIGPDRAPSLSKDMHPVLAGVIVAASVALVAAYFLLRPRPEAVDA
jgi:hypothetical protein